MNFIDDLKKLVDGEEVKPELQNLVDALHAYMGKSKVKDEKELVNVMIMVSAMMNVPAPLWDRTVERLYRVLIKTRTGLDVNEIVKEMMNEPKGPLH